MVVSRCIETAMKNLRLAEGVLGNENGYLYSLENCLRNQALKNG